MAPGDLTSDQQDVRSLDFWRGIAGGLHVQDMDFLKSHSPMAPAEATLQNLRDLLRQEGYFQLPPQKWGLPIEAMAELVRHLDERGLPLPFSFVYDEFWLLYFRLHKVIGGILGPGYLRLPDFWTWLVDPRRGQSGWAAHRDKNHDALFPDRSPKSITVWLPLTDATTLNGCMYVVPADRDPVYGTADDGKWSHQPSDVRALPAKAGSVLCWTQALLHWGSSTSRRETRPRISVAFEFQSGQVPPFNQPLTKPDQIPSHELRLALIAKQILQYSHMYALSPEIADLAKSLLKPAAKQLSAAATPAP